MSFANAGLLMGLAAILIPVAVHFFGRKKYDEVDWAAIQFLSVSTQTRRRRALEQIALLALRIGVVMLLVAALAAPTIPSRWLPRLVRQTSQRDIVLIIDQSASMKGPSTTAARDWCTAAFDAAGSRDRIAILGARRVPVPVLTPLTELRSRWSASLELLPTATGSVDWPAAIHAAEQLFDQPSRERHIVLIHDGRKLGWADPGALGRWGLLASRSGSETRLWSVDLGGESDAAELVRIEPLRLNRPVIVADREFTVRTSVRAIREGSKRPESVSCELDGRLIGSVPVNTDGQVTITRRLPAGSHAISVMAGAQRDDLAFDVLAAIPVLIVDGDSRNDGRSRGSDFLRDALAPMKDPNPSFRVRTESISEFSAKSLGNDPLTQTPAPRVLVLSNVARLTSEQDQAVEAFLRSGGGVLATFGDRCDPAAWNRISYRAGQGWLPAMLGTTLTTANPADSPRPVTATALHRAFSRFREPLPGGLHTAVFPQRWKLEIASTQAVGSATVACAFSTGEPFAVDRGFGKGRVLITAVPLDQTWGTNLPTLPDFVRLAHELIYALVGSKLGERTVPVGQALVLTPDPAEPPAGVTVQAPDRAPELIPCTKWPLVYTDTESSGIYSMTTAGGRTTWFAVRGDPGETDPTRCSDADRDAVARLVPGLTAIATPDEIDSRQVDGVSPPRDLWWVALVAVLVFFFLELSYVRRLMGPPEPVSRGRHAW